MPDPAPAAEAERDYEVRTDASREGSPRLSGLQLPEHSLPAAEPKATRSLAVNQTASYRWTLAEDLEGFARAGIGGIGLYRPKVEEVDEDLAIDMIRASGLAVSSLSWIGGFTGSDGAKTEEALYDAGEAIRFAAAVGAGTVGIVSGGSGNHITRHARRLLVDAVKRLCDDAGELDVRLALHPLSAATSSGQSIVTSLREAVEVIAAVDRTNLGLIFDLGELGREPQLATRIPEVAPFVHVVRLSDRRPRPTGRRYGGTLCFGETLRAFVDSGYDGCFEFDPWTEANGVTPDYDVLLASCRARFEAFLAIDGEA